MIRAEDFVNELIKHDTGAFLEVPCSILKPIINYILDKGMPLQNPVNEAIAMGIAAGEYMSTGKIPVVMMQNSGFCNITNALTSLHQIYNVPVLLVVTWRGFGGRGKDAPEHDITGEKMEEMLKCFGIPYEILDENFPGQIDKMVSMAKKTKNPTCLVMKKGFIEPYERNVKKNNRSFSRYEAIKVIKENSPGSLFISSNGFPTRDSFAAADTEDFYMMGSMGHALPIGIGVASNTEKRVIVIDGDGSALMHAGSMASAGAGKLKNLTHVILDNGVYDSTGGQPTLSSGTDFKLLGKSFGYKNIVSVSDKSGLLSALRNAGPSMIHVSINSENISSAKRVSDVYTCPEVKDKFMKAVKK